MPGAWPPGGRPPRRGPSPACGSNARGARRGTTRGAGRTPPRRRRAPRRAARAPRLWKKWPSVQVRQRGNPKLIAADRLVPAAAPVIGAEMAISLSKPVVHLELHTGDLDRARDIYSDLCGWRAERID